MFSGEAGASAIGSASWSRWAKKMFGYTLQIVKCSDQKSFQVLPKRWIVERTFAWLNWSRRLAKDYELRHTSAETMIHIAFAHQLLRYVP
jgi:putative transposase